MSKDRSAWERCIAFHGHACPGLAIGYRVCEAAADKMQLRFSQDEEVVCVTENDACGVDAIQLLTGCSLGKGNLVYRGTGKQAFSFFKRASGEKMRFVFRKQLQKEGMDRQAMQEYILNAPLDELFECKEPSYEIPVKARLFASVTCEICGESAPERKMRLQDGKTVCLDCVQRSEEHTV